jgi:hypothetical protein
VALLTLKCAIFCTGCQTGVLRRHFGDTANWISHNFGDDMKMKVTGVPIGRGHIEKYEK